MFYNKMHSDINLIKIEKVSALKHTEAYALPTILPTHMTDK